MTLFRTGVLFPFFLPMIANAEATISLRAVAKNGTPITPTSNLSVAPGDIVTADFFLSGWSTPPFDGGAGVLHGYQIALKPDSVHSGSCGTILPVGWDDHLEKMASIDSGPPGQPNFVYYANPTICAVDVSNLKIRWACLQFDGGQIAGRCQGGEQQGQPCGTNAQCAGGVCNVHFQFYAGTLNLEVGPDACGVFTFVADGAETFFLNDSSSHLSFLPTLQPLVLTTNQICAGACCRHGAQSSCRDDVCAEDCTTPGERFGGLGSTCTDVLPPCGQQTVSPQTQPRECAIDARIPFLPGQPNERRGFSSLTWVFQNSISSMEDDPADFEITQIPSETEVVAPVISSVVPGADNTIILNLSSPIQPHHWTCVRHLANNTLRCIGSLPGDAGGNRSAGVLDIFDIIDNLNGVRNPPMRLYECDIDRSGACTPADILSEIDLLNGANGFPAQKGSTLPPCPGTMP